MSKLRRLIGVVVCLCGPIVIFGVLRLNRNTPLSIDRSGLEPAGAKRVGDELGKSLAGNGYVCVPLTQRSTGTLDVTVRINDQDVVFFVDTGATDTTINLTSAEQLHLSRQLSGRKITGIGGTSQELEKVVFEKVRLGTTELSFDALLGDLSSMNQTQVERGLSPHDGFLGMDLLISYIAIIDYGSARLFLRNPRSTSSMQQDSQHDKPALEHVALFRRQGYIEVPIIPTNTGLAVVEVEVNGDVLRFLVDTGAMVCLLDEAATRRMKLPTDGSEPILIRGNGGEEEVAQSYVIEKFVIGGIPVHLGVFSKDLKDINGVLVAQGDAPVEGFLGSNLLMHFSSVLDCSSGKLFLRVPNSQ